jgi:hypothetical protein
MTFPITSAVIFGCHREKLCQRRAARADTSSLAAGISAAIMGESPSRRERNSVPRES